MVNHVGFIVDNVQKRVAEWKAAGVPVLPGTNNRPDQAFVVTPDGVRIEILEDKTQTVPIKNEHVHFFVPEADSPEGPGLVRQDLRRRRRHPQRRAGGRPSRRPASLQQGRHGPGATRHRVLDHIGFD